MVNTKMPKEWLEQFEKECNGYRVVDENKIIQSKRFFLEDGVREWYSSNLRKLLSKWSEWSAFFPQVYADKS